MASEWRVAHQVDGSEWKGKITFLSELMKSGDVEMAPNDVVKVLCSIITK